jgi:hypothetical protein
MRGPATPQRGLAIRYPGSVQSDPNRVAYEVVCPACRVTFPVGTRRCIHCGGRVGPAATAGPPIELPPPGEDAEVGDVMRPRIRTLSPMTVIWILLLLAGSLYRTCHV